MVTVQPYVASVNSTPPYIVLYSSCDEIRFGTAHEPEMARVDLLLLERVAVNRPR